jgi:hypothetical protein
VPLALCIVRPASPSLRQRRRAQASTARHHHGTSAAACLMLRHGDAATPTTFLRRCVCRGAVLCRAVTLHLRRVIPVRGIDAGAPWTTADGISTSLPAALPRDRFGDDDDAGVGFAYIMDTAVSR